MPPKHKRRADDERAEEELMREMTTLSIDKVFVAPQWLIDFGQFSGVEDQLKELIRLSHINPMVHNVLTAIKSAVERSTLADYFECEGADVKPEDRETFKRVFDDRVLPHKSNSYIILCPEDPDLALSIDECMAYLAVVCSAMDIDNLFSCLAIMATLRLQPLTNPVAIEIHRRLAAMPDDSQRLAALKSQTRAQWSDSPQDYAAMRRETFWTREARISQARDIEQSRAKFRPRTAEEKAAAQSRNRPVSQPLAHQDALAKRQVSVDDDNDVDDKMA